MKIKDIGEVMIKQDSRHTQFPLFVIQVDVLRYVGNDGNWDVRERKSSDYYNNEDLCESCLKLQEEESDLPEDCGSCSDTCFAFYEKDQEFDLTAGVFFTAASCEEHIRLNDYHYKNPRSYEIGAWRNPEMQEVMRHLCELAGEVPSHYRSR